MLPKLNDFYDKAFQVFCEEIGHPVEIWSRRWEWWKIAQAIERYIDLHRSKGLGFGCGDEPLPVYFARHGAHITVTDLDPDDEKKTVWDTKLKTAEGCSEDTLSRIQLDYVDMTAIPDHLLQQQFDFLWSASSFEHLGSLQAGSDFVIKSMQCLKPGGIAAHTTEFNVERNDITINDEVMAVYRKRDIDDLVARCEAAGHKIIGLSYEQGEGIEVDIQPFEGDYSLHGDRQHINMRLAHLVITPVLLVIEKASR